VVFGRFHFGLSLINIFRTVIEGTITNYQLAAAYRAFFDIATGHMELAFENRAIMAGDFGSIQVALFLAVTDTRNGSPL